MFQMVMKAEPGANFRIVSASASTHGARRQIMFACGILEHDARVFVDFGFEVGWKIQHGETLPV